MNPQVTHTVENSFLTKDDINIIRKFLPYDWRLQITEKHPAITTRQITETFALRTRNAEAAEIVFSTIATILDNLGQADLATKCTNRIKVCKVAQHVPAV